MKTPLAVLFLVLSSMSPGDSFAGRWALMAPDLVITEKEATPANNWVVLESFATLAECNERRSFMIRQIDKERRDLRAVEGRGPGLATERELRLLWDIYTRSKCVWSR
jgi:hypothetical protein